MNAASVEAEPSEAARNVAASHFARYILLSQEEKRAFDELMTEWRNRPYNQKPSWFSGLAFDAAPTHVSAHVPAPAAVIQRHSEPLMVNAIRTKEKEEPMDLDYEDNTPLLEEPLDERCVNVCTPKTKCACRYKLTDREESVPKLDFKTVAVFFPSPYHADWKEAELRHYVQNLVRAAATLSSVVSSMYAVPGRKHRGTFVTPYVLVQCPTHAHAVRVYTIIRRAIERHDLSISLNWGRKRNV